MKKTTPKIKQEKYSAFKKIHCNSAKSILFSKYMIWKFLALFGGGYGISFVCFFFNIANLPKIKLDLKCHH